MFSKTFKKIAVVCISVALVFAAGFLNPAEAHDRSRGRVTVSGSVWDRLAQCESGGNWNIKGRRYSGGLQFDAQTWRSVGGTSIAGNASKEEQIARAKVLQLRRGWKPWPGCSKRLGLR